MPAAATLARVLARQQLLLVLDNCEHVISTAAGLCAELVAACDDLRVLATSREALQVAGEARYRLGPLAVPDPGDLADLAGAEAVVLFVDRARQADAHFVLDGRTGPQVARLVARLDGMPLAIELAAARVEALGVGQLLDEQERRAFRAVSVFPGPFTLQGAEAAAALAGYALRAAEEAAEGLQTRAGEAAAARRLDAEDPTMRQVLAWALDHDPAIGLRLAVALASWWLLRGRLAGQYPLLGEIAGRAEAGSEGWCGAQMWLSRAALSAAELAGALGHFTAVLDAAGDRGGPPLAGHGPGTRLPGRRGDSAEDPRHRRLVQRRL